jgi:hypothetical protein
MYLFFSKTGFLKMENILEILSNADRAATGRLNHLNIGSQAIRNPGTNHTFPIGQV